MTRGLEDGLVANHAEFQANRPIGEWESMKQCMGKMTTNELPTKFRKPRIYGIIISMQMSTPQKKQEMMGVLVGNHTLTTHALCPWHEDFS